MTQIRVGSGRLPLPLSAVSEPRRHPAAPSAGCEASTREARSNLASRLRAGDEAALDELLELHWDELLRYASDLVSSVDAAEDLVQRAYIRLWERRARWRAETTPRALLFRIVRNLALNEQRRSRVRRLWSRSQSRAARPAPSPLDHAVASDVREAARKAIRELPQRRQEIFRLARDQGLSYQEIAQCLDISPQTVANQMSAALSSLRRALAPFVD